MLNGQLVDIASGELIELGEVSSLGRDPESVVPINDPRVSRRHAMIRRQSNGFWFHDLGSRNRSYINHRLVSTGQLLRNGDLLKIGSREFRFVGGLVNERPDTKMESAQTVIETQSRDVIILVSDIQGFTSLSEQLSPEGLSLIMSSWYDAVGKAVEKHGGMIDKFIGDCVLAYWLNTSHPSRLDALKAAHAMQQVAECVQRQHQESLSQAGVVFRTGAAIHLGTVAYGAVGAGEFTLLGDAVNLAFRLEALTREFSKPVLVSEDFLSSWETGRALCEPCGSRQVKGRAAPVNVFSLERDPA